MSLIHSSYYRPRIYPFVGGDPAEIDRLQDLTGSLALNREKIREIGRDGTIDWRKRIPTLRLTARQLEYGSMEFWRKITNKPDSTNTITLNDFKSSMFDIVGYKTDDDGTFLSSVWYPKLRTSGFSINIGDPQALVERSFDFVGEDEIILQEGNKYFIFREFTVDAGSNTQVTVSDGTTYPHPAYDPDNSASYLLKVTRERAGVGTELVLTTDYSYNPSTHILTIVTTAAADKIRVYWSAATAGTQTFFTNNDTDIAAVSADSVSLYLLSANYLYKLQSAAINVSFDRTDYYEIGDDEVVQRGVREKTVTMTIGRILDGYTIEEVLRGQTDIGKINPRNFNDNFAFIMKIYSAATKTSFLMKYHATDVAATNVDAGVPLNDYITRGATLESESLTISSVE